MRYVIEHETSRRFPAPVREHQCELRLTPRQDAIQRVHAVHIDTDPAAELFTYIDSFGNRVHYFSLIAPHDCLVTRLHTEVETLLDNPFDYTALSASQEHTWFTDRLRTEPHLWSVVLHHSPMTPDLTHLQQGLELPCYDPQQPLLYSVQAAMNWISATLSYQTGVTNVHTPLETVLSARAGVCQDFAHLLIALVRSWGFPARYVMGYLDPSYIQSPDIKSTTHAWAEVLIPGAGSTLHCSWSPTRPTLPWLWDATTRMRRRSAAASKAVELFPVMNPLGLDTLKRLVPVYDTDLNRNFSGHDQGPMPQRIAEAVMRQVRDAMLVIDTHASNIFLREIPQVRINQTFADTLVPLAQRMNVDLIWLHGGVTVLEATVAHSLNSLGGPCLVVEMGVGMRVTPAFSEQLVIGVLNLWRDLGVLAADLDLPAPSRMPLIADDHNVYYLNAATSGLFIPTVDYWISVHEGELLGRIVSPHHGAILSAVRSPVHDILFTLREYPLVYEGSLMALIMATEEGERSRVRGADDPTRPAVYDSAVA